MRTAPLLQLSLFFATENDSALILRRSQKKLYNLIGWDRRSDTFTQGQWIRKSIDTQVCALSPDGQHFLYAVRDARPDTPATAQYTVLSRVPWFSALALFPHGSGWYGGGEFLDNTLYQLNGSELRDDIIGRAEGLSQVVAGEVTKDCRTGLRLRNGKAAPLSKPMRERLLAGDPAPRPNAHDRYDTQAGRLYRRRGMELELIRDFADMQPRFEPAPYSAPKGQDASWSPLDHEESK
jgi:hypothetical protein